MFRNMKPLPKALIIGIIIGLPIFVYVKMSDTLEAKLPATEVVVQPTPAEQAKVDAEAAVKAATEAAQQTATPLPNVTNGDAGLDAVLKAGKK